MIGRRELERRAGELGIGLPHVERDYVLQHLLTQIARAPGRLVFRGGTALARVYWPDFRISEDLDFVAEGPVDDLDRVLARAVSDAADVTGLQLELEPGGFRDDHARVVVRWAAPWSADGDVLLDVVRWQRIAVPAVTRSLDLRYSDLHEVSGVEIPVLDLGEILANKWFMLDDREEPRDLYDLWWGLTQQAVDFAGVAHAHRATYGYPPAEGCLDRATRLETRWAQRLAYQMHDLVPFGVALGAVRGRFDAWRRLTSDQV